MDVGTGQFTTGQGACGDRFEGVIATIDGLFGFFVGVNSHHYSCLLPVTTSHSSSFPWLEGAGDTDQLPTVSLPQDWPSGRGRHREA